MDEKILIKSNHYSVNKYVKTTFAVSIILIILGILLYLFNFNSCRFRVWYDGDVSTYSVLNNMLDPFSLEAGMLWDLGIILIILSLLIKWWLSSYELTISDKRIYGKTSFGKRVDLPVDSISAVSTSMLKGIAVATSSGKIVFKLIKNRDEIHSEISNLIISRQTKEATGQSDLQQQQLTN